MLSHPILQFSRRVFTVLLLLGGAARAGSAQSPGWYLGVQGGTSFGQATFASITEHQIHWGAQGGLLAGYGLNDFLSLEAAVQYGGQTQSALDCCPYWLSADGQRYLTPVLDAQGWSYQDLGTITKWGRAALQVNLNLIGLFARSSRLSLNLSPQIAAVTTQTTLTTPDDATTNPRQWHFGYGGQASLGYLFGERIGAALYGGITSLTGERFDNIPYHAHETNLLWDAGLRLTFHLGKAAPKGPSAAELAAAEAAKRAAEEAARLAEERAEADRIAREQAEREAAARAAREAELAAREAAERAAREAAEAKERAFRTPIPTVYFANDSRAIEPSYLPPLEEALAILRQYPDFNLEIHAYTSRSGSKAYNEKLSEQRMEAIRGWFTAHGIGLERMGQAYYHGIDYNAPSADKARRAELKFVK